MKVHSVVIRTIEEDDDGPHRSPKARVYFIFFVKIR